MTYLEHLAEAIKQMHGCNAVYVDSKPVKEVFEGRTIWDGEVAVFMLSGHPKAAVAFAWGYPPDSPKTIHAVLGIGPVDSPENAVKAFIASEIKKAPTPKH